MSAGETSSPREELRRLLADVAVLRGDFVLSSGKRSSYYVDARLVSLSARGSLLIGQVFLGMLQEDLPDAVGGLTLGADPIVSAITTVSALGSRPIDGLIVRKEAKTHGGRRRIEGPWKQGMAVAIVEDTVTTGASALEAASAVRDEGGAATGVYGLIDRQEGGREAIEAAGYPVFTAFTISELL